MWNGQEFGCRRMLENAGFGLVGDKNLIFLINQIFTVWYARMKFLSNPQQWYPSKFIFNDVIFYHRRKIDYIIYTFIHLCHKQSPVGHMGHMVCPSPRCQYCMSCHQCQNNTRLEVQVLNLWALKQLAELNHVDFRNCKGNQLIWSRSL